VPRPAATAATEGRVSRLVALLFSGFRDERGDIAVLAREAQLEHETVRALLRNPGGRKRTGPAFFVVAAIARARGISLDYLAAETLELTPDGQRR
jgi:hypothetical protein